MNNIKYAAIFWILGVVGLTCAIALSPIWVPILLGKKLYAELGEAGIIK